MRKTTAAAVLAAALSAGMAAPAVAATLSNAEGQSCDGTGTWHFVNNQTGGATSGTLTATFEVDGSTITVTDSTPRVLRNVLHFEVTTEGDATLISASTGSVPGRLVLSDFTCEEDGDGGKKS